MVYTKTGLRIEPMYAGLSMRDGQVMIVGKEFYPEKSMCPHLKFYKISTSK